MMARMQGLQDIRLKFSNQRQWRDFVSAVQCTVNFVNVSRRQQSGVLGAITHCNSPRVQILP
jgi:hypothetical protein